MKFEKLIEYNKIIILLQKSCRKWGSESKGSAALFHYISIILKLGYNKRKLYKVLRLLIQRYTQIRFFRKESWNKFSAVFCVLFLTKIFLMLYSINWPNLIFWFPLLLEILGNMCIAIVHWPGCDVTHFLINLVFLIRPFFDQKVKTKTLISW